MKLTYIYVKKLPNGVLYLGKTVKDPKNYLGSGKLWLRIIKKYKYSLSDIETWILHRTENYHDLKTMGEYYSKLFNVVEYSQWANLKPENGDGGQGKGFMKDNPNHPVKRQAVRDKIRKTMLGDSNWIRGKFAEKAPMFGYKHTLESKEKIKQAALKHAKRKKVCQYDKNENFIKLWESMSEAEKDLNIHHIGAVCNGKRKYAGGFIWRFYN